MARKDEILDALIDIFKNKGVGSDFTISELAQKVNIGKSTIYEYFKTKEDIVNASVGRFFQTTMVRILDREPIVNTTFEQAFKKEAGYLFDLALNSRFLVNIVTPELRNAMPPVVRDRLKDHIKGVANFYENRFREIFRLGVDEGIIPNQEDPVKATLVYSLVTGSIMRIGNFNSDNTVEVNLDDYSDALYKAVVKLAT